MALGTQQIKRADMVKGSYREVSIGDSCGSDNPGEPFLPGDVDSRPRRKSGWLKRALSIAHCALTLSLLVTTIVYVKKLSNHLEATASRTAKSTATRYEPLMPEDIGVVNDPGVLNHGRYTPFPIKSDLFHNITIMEQRLAETGWYHFPSGVMLEKDRDYPRWRDNDGIERQIYPTTQQGGEAYLIGAFHQMHCLMEFTRDYGLLLNGYKPLWSEHHTIHCLNIFYKIIECLADPSATGFSVPQTKPIDDMPQDQRVSEMTNQPMCRDVQALKRWALEPTRAAKMVYNSDIKEQYVRLPRSCDLTNCRSVDGEWR